MGRGKDKTALILTGGGIMGAAYEIGALTALDRLFRSGFSCNHFDMYIGISAGSIIASLLANRVQPAALFQAIANNEASVFNWRRKDIYRLELRDLVRSCGQVLRHIIPIFKGYRKNRWEITFHDLFYMLQEQFPAGLFSLSPMQNYLCESFAKERITDNFTDLETELYIPAYDLDQGVRVVFGSADHRDMHLCQAITASCAIPYFFRPHPIGNHCYVDGSVGSVAHLDIALEHGANLILIVNPRVPINNDLDRFCLPTLSRGECSSVSNLGISFAWEQAKRIENKEKLDRILEIYRHSHPQVDIVLVEPGKEESLLFFQSPMSNAARHHVMNYGYHLTLGQLRQQYDKLHKLFKRRGVGVTGTHLTAPPPAEIRL